MISKSAPRPRWVTVHQDICCREHGCYYSDLACPVVSAEVIQSWQCRSCPKPYCPFTREVPSDLVPVTFSYVIDDGNPTMHSRYLTRESLAQVVALLDELS